MATEVLNLFENESYWRHIRRAAAALAAGGLVAFPTETVYGLGANAADAKAIARLREVKERKEEKPFTVHIARRSDVDRFVPDLTPIGRRLIEKGWPGPLTLIFHVADTDRAAVADSMPDRKTHTLYHEGTIGLRCPDNDPARDLLNEAAVPVVAASANRGGNPPAVTAAQVLDDLDGRIDLVLDGGRSRYAEASTIVRVAADGYEVVRKGVYDERTIRRLLSVSFLFVCSGNTCRSPMAAGLFRRRLADRVGCAPDELESRGYSVLSAGVSAVAGLPASDAGVAALRSRGVDVSGHRSQPLRVEHVHAADYIFAMCRSHADAVVSLVPSAEGRCRLLDETGDIDDPVGGDDSVYQACAERIDAAVRRRVEELAL